MKECRLHRWHKRLAQGFRFGFGSLTSRGAPRGDAPHFWVTCWGGCLALAGAPGEAALQGKALCGAFVSD